LPIFSRQFEVWRRLYERMKLEPSPADAVAPQVSEVIVPILNADLLLQTPTVPTTVTSDLSGTAGDLVIVNLVPPGEEWHMIWIYREVTAGNTQLSLRIGGPIQHVSPLEKIEISKEIRGFVLREGDQVVIRKTGNGSDTAIDTMVTYNLIQLAE
jgi:hypothetical protein